jgi:Tfp pilus assembly protein PilF
MAQNQRIEQLLQFLENEPTDLFLNYALALEYAADINNTQQALLQFEKVLELDMDYIPAFYQLGKLHEALKDNDKALEYYRKGIQ